MLHVFFLNSDENMEVTAYCNKFEYVELDKFNDWFSCDKLIESKGIGCGCRRTVGPFSLINQLADMIL